MVFTIKDLGGTSCIKSHDVHGIFMGFYWILIGFFHGILMICSMGHEWYMNGILMGCTMFQDAPEEFSMWYIMYCI